MTDKEKMARQVKRANDLIDLAETLLFWSGYLDSEERVEEKERFSKMYDSYCKDYRK